MGWVGWVSGWVGGWGSHGNVFAVVESALSLSLFLFLFLLGWASRQSPVTGPWNGAWETKRPAASLVNEPDYTPIVARLIRLNSHLPQRDDSLSTSGSTRMMGKVQGSVAGCNTSVDMKTNDTQDQKYLRKAPQYIQYFVLNHCSL